MSSASGRTMSSPASRRHFPACARCWSGTRGMAQFSLPASELLMVDDLKPGYDMARAAGVDFAAAGWAYDVPEIEAFMRKNCDFYFKTVQEFRTFLEED